MGQIQHSMYCLQLGLCLLRFFCLTLVNFLQTSGIGGKVLADGSFVDYLPLHASENRDLACLYALVALPKLAQLARQLREASDLPSRMAIKMLHEITELLLGLQ